METVFRAAGDFTVPQWRIFTWIKYAIIFFFGAVLLMLYSWPTKIARLTYTLGFMLMAVLLWAIRNWGEEWIPYDICLGECFKYAIVYQVSLAFVIYHTLLALLTIGLRNEEPDRAIVHNGLWLFKAVILFGLIVLCFYIEESFFSGYAIVVTIGALVFLVVQALIVLDISEKLSSFFYQKIEDRPEGLWGSVIIMLVIINFTLAQGASVVFYYYLSDTDAIVPAGTNNILFILFTLLSELPGVKFYKRKTNKAYSGLFQSSFLAVFVTYITASAIGSDPTLQMNDMLWQALFWSGLAGTVILLCLTSMSSVVGDEWDALEERRDYNYSALHLVFALGGFYVAALLTNWALFGEGGNFEEEEFAVGQGYSAFWIKAVMAWIISVFYMLKLALPTMYKDKFGGERWRASVL